MVLANENSKLRAGQWNRDALTNCYLAQLPRKFLRAMAGFKPNGMGGFGESRRPG
jgi:hypothetical protein